MNSVVTGGGDAAVAQSDLALAFPTLLAMSCTGPVEHMALCTQIAQVMRAVPRISVVCAGGPVAPIAQHTTGQLTAQSYTSTRSIPPAFARAT